MSSTAIIIIALFCLLGSVVALYFLSGMSGSKGMDANMLRSNLGSMVASQRETSAFGDSIDRKNAILDNVAQVRSVSSKMTLEKKIKYSQLKISPAAFRLCQIGISIAAFFLSSIKFNLFIQVMFLSTGPLVMNAIIGYYLNRRFNAFDKDYAPFILSLVGLLKTGMNVMSALETAAHGLEEGSLVKEEVNLMMERLRFGVSEDKSIGAFGEDIAHPEIELFVQALLLSRRVGGTLSDTLDRLSRQVRRRQYFRKAAVSAVGMQRGSIWFIIAILVALEGYLFVISPEFVVGAWDHPLGWQVWQTGMALIALGIFWVRQVTKIKV